MLRAIKTFIVRKYINTANVNYPKMLVLKGDYQSGEILSQGYYEKPFVDFIAKNIHKLCPDAKNGIMIDIGASYGTYSLFFAKYFKQIIAFEPGENSFNILMANIKINNINNILTQNCGLANFEGKAKFIVPDNDNGSAFVIPHGSEKKYSKAKTYSVGVKQLDSYMSNLKQYDSFRVELIKIDAEGMEESILKSSEHLIKQHTPVILFEAFTSDKLVATKKLLDSFGYNYYVELIQSRRIWENKYLNLLTFILTPDFLKKVKISSIKNKNYQVIVAQKSCSTKSKIH